jgi:hypothetical protein
MISGLEGTCATSSRFSHFDDGLGIFRSLGLGEELAMVSSWWRRLRLKSLVQNEILLGLCHLPQQAFFEMLN